MAEKTSQHRARRIIDRHKEMKQEKSLWNNLYQLMGEYIMTRKQHFTDTGVQGEIQTGHLFDDTAPNANHLMASSLIGALWPNGAKSVRIDEPFGLEEEIGDDTDEVKKFYERATKRLVYIMDNPKGGFLTALEEYMLDQGAFGISGINTIEQEDNHEVPFCFRALDAKSTCIGEGANGFVNTIYIEQSYDIRQLVDKYGYENISVEWQKLYEKGDAKTKVRVLQAIEPRMEHDPYGFGVKNMPFASIHIDIKTEKIMMESGFSEMPAAVTRFWKAMGEKYGRSPGMNALASILEANALGEAYILGVEKTLDPTLVVTDDGVAGNGTIDTSPGAIIVTTATGRMTGNQKPVEPLFLVGDLTATGARRTELVEIIKNHFFQDRLMDLNNEQRMTLGEANIRNGLRGMTLNTVYSRQMAEQFIPTIERVVNGMQRRGMLGVVRGSQQELAAIARGETPLYIPDAVAKRMKDGKEYYRITFISPATRIMQSEELQGLQQTTQFATEVAPFKPEIMDRLDTDFIIGRIQELTGASSEALNSLETVRKTRDARSKAQAAMQQNEQSRQQSETNRNTAQAASQVAQIGQQGAA